MQFKDKNIDNLKIIDFKCFRLIITKNYMWFIREKIFITVHHPYIRNYLLHVYSNESHDPHLHVLHIRGKTYHQNSHECLQTFTKFQPSIIKLSRTITLIRSSPNVIRTGEINILLIIVLHFLSTLTGIICTLPNVFDLW